MPLFFGFDAFGPVSVPAFGQLANLKINISQKFLAEPISKLVPFFILPKNILGARPVNLAAVMEGCSQ